MSNNSKTIKDSDTKAFQIQAVESANGQRFLGIRQLYATKNDPEFKPAKQGVSIPYNDTGRAILKAMIAMFKAEDLKFKKLDDGWKREPGHRGLKATKESK